MYVKAVLIYTFFARSCIFMRSSETVTISLKFKVKAAIAFLGLNSHR